MNWYIQALTKYAEFNGRGRRSGFWYFVLFKFLIFFIITFLDFADGSYCIQSAIYSFLIIILSFAVTIRGLHDINPISWDIRLSNIPILDGLIVLIFMIHDSKDKMNIGLSGIRWEGLFSNYCINEVYV